MNPVRYYGAIPRPHTADPARGAFEPSKPKKKPGQFRQGKTKRDRGARHV